MDDEIVNELKGKEGCINDLLDAKGNSYVKNLLANFKGESEFDIKIESVNELFEGDSDEISGRTLYEGGSLINIQINSSSASARPVLDVARTILHEYIHADMFRKTHTESPTPGIMEFRDTFNKYKQEKFQASAQHETMAELYVDEMASALRAFHKNALPNDYNYITNNGNNPLPYSFYEGLAWRGLKNHGVAAYDSLSLQKKKELEESIERYYFSTTKNCLNN